MPPPHLILPVLILPVLTPLHRCTTLGCVRLTVNLDSDLYAVAVSLAKAEDCSISAAVNRLLRRGLPGDGEHDLRSAGILPIRNGFVVSRGARPITAETVRRSEAEDDAT